MIQKMDRLIANATMPVMETSTCKAENTGSLIVEAHWADINIYSYNRRAANPSKGPLFKEFNHPTGHKCDTYTKF